MRFYQIFLTSLLMLFAACLPVPKTVSVLLNIDKSIISHEDVDNLVKALVANHQIEFDGKQLATEWDAVDKYYRQFNFQENNAIISGAVIYDPKTSQLTIFFSGSLEEELNEKEKAIIEKRIETLIKIFNVYHIELSISGL